MSNRHIASWLETVLRPILVNVLTAGVLFAMAVVFKPQIYALLDPPGIPEYPLVCYAEPRPGEPPEERIVEFFIINLKGDRVDRSSLLGLLRNFGPKDRLLIPDIRLAMNERGNIVSATTDIPFNEGKGDIQPEIGSDQRSVALHINWIEEDAIVRVDLKFAEARDLGTPRRMAKNMVPFDYPKSPGRCFQS